MQKHLGKSFSVGGDPKAIRTIQSACELTDVELQTPLGLGLIGTSSVKIEVTDRYVTCQPWLISISALALWMYLVWAGLGVFTWWLPPDRISWAIWVLSGLFIVPAFLAMFFLMNQYVGDRPYLIFDKVGNSIELPRLMLSFRREDVLKLVYLEGVFRNQHLWQVSLLANTGEGFCYAHVFNCGGSEMGMLTSSTGKELADAIGVSYSQIRVK